MPHLLREDEVYVTDEHGDDSDGHTRHRGLVQSRWVLSGSITGSLLLVGVEQVVHGLENSEPCEQLVTQEHGC